MPSTLPPLRDLLAWGGFRLRSETRADCARCEGRSRGTVSYNAEVAHCFRCGWAANRYQLAREARQVAQTSVCGFPLVPGRRANPGGRDRPGAANGNPQTEVCATQIRATRGQRASTRHKAAIRAFACWREERLRQVSDAYLGLSRAARRAGQALAREAFTPSGVVSAGGAATSGGVVASSGALTSGAATSGRAVTSVALTPAERELAWDALARFHHAEAELSAAFDLLMCAKAGAWLEDDASIEDLFAMWREK